jgi:hypothetical protein
MVCEGKLEKIIFGSQSFRRENVSCIGLEQLRQKTGRDHTVVPAWHRRQRNASERINVSAPQSQDKLGFCG